MAGTGGSLHGADQPVNDLARLYAGNPAPSPTVVMRTDAVRGVGGYPTWLSVGEDYLLYIRLRRAGWRLAYVDVSLRRLPLARARAAGRRSTAAAMPAREPRCSRCCGWRPT